MKRTSHFVPNKDGQLAGWGANYEQKIALHGPAIGLTPEHREYMAMCYDGVQDIGQQSDVTSIVFGG